MTQDNAILSGQNNGQNLLPGQRKKKAARLYRALGIPLLLLFLLLTGAAPLRAGADTGAAFATKGRLVTWIKSYRLAPAPERLPDAVQAMRRHGLLEDQDRAGLYIGFTAGVLGDNEDMAEDLVKAMFPLPPKEQVLIIKALAYSGLPQWKPLLAGLVERMPARKVLIDKYLFRGGKSLMDVPLDRDPAILDTLWGYYIATGRPGPIRRIIEALKWDAESPDLDKVIAAQMAKWTLAANAERDPDLLPLYRRVVLGRPPEIARPLRQVIAAAQAFESERIKKQAQKAVALARKGGRPSKWATAGKYGATALSIGCVAAGALGHPEIAAPCVITGAIYSGAVKLFQGK